MPKHTVRYLRRARLAKCWRQVDDNYIIVAHARLDLSIIDAVKYLFLLKCEKASYCPANTVARNLKHKRKERF